MKNIILKLPTVEKELESAQSLSDKLPEGYIWFSENHERQLWCSALGQPACDALVLSAGAYALRLKLIAGPDKLQQLQDATTRLIYLPREGTSDKDLNKWLVRHRPEIPYHFVRLFLRSDLGLTPGEASPLKELWRKARAEFGLSPFLGINNEQTRQGLREWLSRIVVLVNLRAGQPLLAEQMRRRIAQADEAGRVWTDVPKELDSKSELINLLLLRDYGRSILDQIQKTANDIALAEHCVEEYPYQMDSLAYDCCNRSGKEIFGVDFVINLGDELLPELQRLIPRLTPFADKLINSSVHFLKPLGQDLKGKLQITTPMLALIGPYSSGKTTLLNILLMEKGAKRAFRTANTANTAIISEINACEDEGREQVKFVFRDLVEHSLVDLDDGQLSPSHSHNIKELLKLIDLCVLENPRLNCTIRINGKPTSQGRDGGRLAGEEVVGREHVLKRLEVLEQATGVAFAGAEKVIFSADVNAKKRAELLGGHLPEVIDLSDDEGWKRFQGDGDDKLPFVEEVSASFLIQTADIRLHNRLLKLTTIADTPGTGSFNDRHDFITDQFIYRAEGVILLLPTTNYHALRVHQIMRKVRNIFVDRYKSPAVALNNIAFVVNCFTRQEEEVNRQRVAEYEDSVREAFGLSQAEWKRRQSNPAAMNFFVVKLKNIEGGENPQQVYGRPSLTSLRTWIRRLFLSGRYRQRLIEIRNVLAGEWNKRRAVLDEMIMEYGLEAKDMEKRIAAVRKFREADLENTKRRYLEEIEGFRHDFVSGPNSVSKRVERHLNNFVADPLDKNRLGTWKEGLKGLYRELNQLLEVLESDDPATQWADAIKHALSGIHVDAPSLVPPDPQRQDIAWGTGSRFSLESVDQKFNEIEQKWPNVLERGWYYIKEKTVGGEDVRRSMAKDLRDSFWTLHYKAVWDRRLETYLQRSLEFIQSKTPKIKQKCLDREKSLRERNETNKKDLEQVVRLFESLEAERNGFIDELETALSGGEKK